MMTVSTIRVAAIAGALSLASVATAQSLCAVNCFQTVVTEHPPLDCTEDSMYLCFCVSPSLQSYFIDCAYDECGSGAQEAINFGVSLCADLGEPITIPERPTTTTAVSEPTEEPEVTTTEVPSEPTDPVEEPTTTAVAEPTSETSSEETSAPEPTDDDVETTAVETTVSTEATSDASSPTESPVDEAPVPEDTTVPAPEASVTPIPSGNSTVPPPTEPTHVDPNMGNSMGVSSMAIAAAVGIAIARVIM